MRYNKLSVFFFFNDTATTEIYTLSLHDALPICGALCFSDRGGAGLLELEHQVDDVPLDRAEASHYAGIREHLAGDGSHRALCFVDGGGAGRFELEHHVGN